MKTKFLIILIICIKVCGYSQAVDADTIIDTFVSARSQPFEIGFTFASVNARNEIMFSNPDEPCLELLNGILFRYKFNKLSLRINFSFNEKQSSKNPMDIADYQFGKSECKSFKIGAGLQWTPLIKKELIYLFLDCNYKSRNENSEIVNIVASYYTFQTIHSKAEGLDMVGGLGTKLRIYKNFYFSMEGGFNQFFGINKKKTIQVSTPKSSTQIVPYRFDTILLRFYLSLTF